MNLNEKTEKNLLPRKIERVVEIKYSIPEVLLRLLRDLVPQSAVLLWMCSCHRLAHLVFPLYRYFFQFVRHFQILIL